MKLAALVNRLNEELGVPDFPDYAPAFNGLQVENRSGEATRVAVAVDACETVINRAVEDGADLLIVHHGLFWTGFPPLTGASFRKVRACLDGNLAVYSCHLPLDAHPSLGNNALILRALNLPSGVPCFPYKNKMIGRMVTTDVSRAELVGRVEAAIGPVTVAAGGPDQVKQLAVCSGGSGGQVLEAAALGADTFLVGEGSHWTYTAAEEAGVNLIYAGHYATETFGVKALGGLVEREFSLPFTFLDHPTGL